jgi:hypothetical protein
MYYRARYYNPQIGRFISEDPLVRDNQADNIHGYSYAHNDPLQFRDPLGLIGIGSTTSFRNRIELAIKTLRAELINHCCSACAQQFASSPNGALQNMCDWLTKDGPPYIYVVKRSPDQPSQDHGTIDTIGFEVAKVFDDIFIRKPHFKNPCELASLILHEIIHLARKDKGREEDLDFQTKCKIGCLDPTKYH